MRSIVPRGTPVSIVVLALAGCSSDAGRERDLAAGAETTVRGSLDAVTVRLPGRLSPIGRFEGSYDPATKTYSTAMATLVLNIYQHFLPAYQR